ncbi:MAG: 50S ribosomal protein L35 [Elusimicrobiota bacterium]|jgi:large subunit ribosomal protein L35|nr:50S ribosomal protein L35 [Elusimicrobiota bacterium]
MIKMKSHSGAKKRFNVSGCGKIKRKKAFARHILTKKSSNRMRKLRKAGTLDGMANRTIKSMIPYK